MLEFRDFTAAPIHVGGEQDRQHQKSYGNRSQVVGKILQPFPGKRGQSGGQQDQKSESKPPQPGFFLFQISGGSGRAFGLIFVFRHNYRHGPLDPVLETR